MLAKDRGPITPESASDGLTPRRFDGINGAEQ